MKKKVRMLCSAGVALVLSPLIISCADELQSGGRQGSDANSIRFAVSVDESSGNVTRAAMEPESFVVDSFAIDGQTAYLICDVTDLAAADEDDTLVTRGTPIYTSTSAAVEGGAKIFNLNSQYGEFKASAYLGGDVTKPVRENYVDTDGKTKTDGAPFTGIAFHYTANEGASGSETKYEYWSPDIADDKFYWWQEYKLTFYAYAPTTSSNSLTWAGPGETAYKNGGKMQFSYTVPVSSASPKTDAEKQPDILITTTGATPLSRPALKTIKLSGVTTTDKYYEVPLKFFHALSGVRFCVDTPGTGDDVLKSYTIESITLSNLCQTATCSFDPTGKTLASSCSSDVISWSSHGTANGIYTQTFNHTIADGTGGEMAYGTKKEQTFMLLPQTLGEPDTNAPSSQVSIVLRDKAGVALTLNVKNFRGSKGATGSETSAWKPGKMYTYRISTKSKAVSVTVDDEIDKSTKTKSNLEIKNDGTAISYIRVAVVANWFKGDTGFSYPYNATKWATDMAACSSNTNWTKGTDGYYYYKYPVLAGKTITSAHTLFSTVTFTDTPPTSDWHLEVKLVVQAVRTNDVKEAWGTNIITTAGLQITPQD